MSATIVLTETITVAAKVAKVGAAAGPGGVVVVGAAVCVAVVGVGRWLFGGGGSSSSRAPPPSQTKPREKVVRKASVEYQRSQQQGIPTGQSSGSGQYPNWNNVQNPGENLNDLRMFERIVLLILKRLRECGANRAERFSLLRTLRDALAELLRRQPDLVVEITADRQLRLRASNVDVVTIPRQLVELFDLRNETDLDLGSGSAHAHRPSVYRIRCRFCDDNYVGQSVNPSRERLAAHASSMSTRRETSSLYQHHSARCCRFGCDCSFEENYQFGVLMEVEEASLRAAEVFWQWLLCGRLEDGGIGRR